MPRQSLAISCPVQQVQPVRPVLAGWAMSSISRKVRVIPPTFPPQILMWCLGAAHDNRPLLRDRLDTFDRHSLTRTRALGPTKCLEPTTRHLHPHLDSTSAVKTRIPPGSTTLGLGITSKPAVASKGKGLALGGKKTTLADALAAEMANELGDAWGEVSAAEATSTGHLNSGSKRAGGWSAPGDLMDVNADHDDWSKRYLKAQLTKNQIDLFTFQPPLKVLLLVRFALHSGNTSLIAFLLLPRADNRRGLG
jgi:hypothetical protein